MRALLVLLALAVGLPAAAQTTGQLSGVVRDASTGETLPGATVIVEETGQGAATNIDGEYRIIGVRPGTYTLVASFVGYAPTRTEQVRINVDLTTTINFELQPEGFTGEEVVVVANADLVRRDLTSSEFRVTSDAIESLPVQEVGDILRTQAGITGSGGAIHIRGGRSKEVAYYVDGVRVTDAYDGSVAVQIENEGIEELQVIAGTYNAEYGQANSGIINVVTKDPGTEVEGSFEVFSGSYVVPGSGGDDVLRSSNVGQYSQLGELPYIDVDPYSYLDVDPSHYYNVQGSISAPVIPNRLGAFGLVRYFQNDGWLYGARVYNPDGTPGDSSLVAMNGFEKLSGQATLKYRLNGDINLTLTSLASVTEGDAGDVFSFRQNPDGRGSYRDEGLSASLLLSHTLSSRAFYTISASTFYKHNRTARFDTIEEYNAVRDPLGRNPYTFLLDTPEFVYTGFDGSTPTDSLQVLTGPGRFLRGGIDLGRFERETRSMALKGDLTWQALDEHLVKTGVEVRQDDIFLESYGLTQDPLDPNTLIIPGENTNEFQRIDGVKPLTISAYVQDKAEYDAFIVNAGLRLDYFDSNGEIPADPQDPNVFNPQRLINRYRDINGNGQIDPDEVNDDNLTTLEERLAYWYTDAEPKLQLSPRLGVAYPITADGVLHFSYGYFFQIPTYEFLFANPGYRIGTLSGTYGPYGNANLDPQKTVMYEIGFKQGFGDDVLLDVTGFYRDIEDWVSIGFPIAGTLPGVQYVVYDNLDFSNVRGITVSLGKRFNGRFSLDADYTFQVAEGSNSDPNDAFTDRQFADPDDPENQGPPLRIIPLGWDQRHTFNASVYVGGDGWGTSLLGRFGSGYPYTPTRPDPDPIGVLPAVATNASRRSSTAALDLYAFKQFDFGGVKPRLFLQVYNLLDSRIENGVYGDTGVADITFDGPNLDVNDPGYYVRPDFYAEPRRVQLGLSASF
ncbi:MAG TPA: TonB-dependent receptor [Bacteroidetes bacterium]|nr:TonB-dependent receptor [Bacteroidota bacterium]HIL56996.1 TonB-dependent receptor [Rhodothermales bacterium]